MNWHLKKFNELSGHQVYKIMQLRVDIFVVEQNCPYSDLDGKDEHPEVLHLFATENEAIVCYLRILPPNLAYPNKPALGRIVSSAQYRGTGAGHQLMQQATQILDEKWPNLTSHMSAQAHLQGFYGKHGYTAVGEEYLEDDIPHIGMERAPLAG
ncbi:GNAT family N-acetyltransferase [Aliikangiella marina]|uniref:GNAT family N-acetyltransferase n=1 Tax=Aliikangiella marina TaxID=1712262 RepID=A0A545T6W6_9GAMM|nr:GNAT family N-acetyltransferase [Aliikangiella marina]TQV72966.1 GNAT family N-acetyltransferase [Aliikangiella marina]